MASEEKKSAISKKLGGYMKSGGRRLALFVGGRTARLFLLMLGMAVAAFMLYTNAWVPSRQDVQLPGGVSARNPGLDSELLQVINTERIERASYQAKSLTSFGPLFAPLGTPTPAPVP